MLVKTSIACTEVVGFFAKEPLAKTRGAVGRLPSRCRVGLGSGTLPLVKRMHSWQSGNQFLPHR